jgi:hypothetical protein
MRCNCNEDTRGSSTLTVSEGWVHTQNVTRYYNTEYSDTKNTASDKSWNMFSPTCHDFQMRPLLLSNSFHSLNKRESLLLVCLLGDALSLFTLERVLLVYSLKPLIRPVVWNIRTAGCLVEPLFGVSPLCQRTEARACMDRVASVPSSLLSTIA